VKLPEKHIVKVELELSNPEKLFYKAIESKAALLFNQLDQRGVVMKSFSSILVLLLRTRQAATHCHLFKDVWEYAMKGEFGLEFMDHSRRRAGYTECPVCMDELQNGIQTPCGHVYCRVCIDGPNFILDEGISVNKGKSCQVCRATFQLVDLIDIQAQIVEKPAKSTMAQNLEKCLALTDEAQIAATLKSASISHDTFKRILYTLHPDGEFGSYISSTKTKELVKILKQIKKEDRRSKTAVFSQWTGLLYLARKELDLCGIKSLLYDGSMSNSDRESVLDEFSFSKEKNILLISLKAGGVGLNLTCASNVIMLDLWCKANL
jgi:DNA repair protein RAD5